ncbi:MAG: CDP-glycerol glycerophosphotransferase (TagB/SpsB family) [Gammaproteobacteria bacterium]|jgi:CDP-glycerol glycerophosphotransferase (TagB/SpsB family)
MELRLAIQNIINDTTVPQSLNMKIGFLFNHEQLHQIPHAVSVAYELSRITSFCEVIIITSSSKQLDYIKTFEIKFPQQKCSYLSISIPSYLSVIGNIIDKAIPFTRVFTLKKNLAVFEKLDVLVAPEETCVMLRTHFGLNKLKFIFTSHGAGDRKIGFKEVYGQFDLILLSGSKYQKRMQEAGILATADSRIIGYPKFDAVDAFSSKRRKIFNNDKPVVFYNPHFAPNFSSWFGMGLDILNYFYNSDKYNLIFAPHVMLFKRKVQLSQEKFIFRWVSRIPERFYECDHILIDTGSISCTDMTYTLASDIYMGDVSSQFYEFLVKPRPCLFANAHNVEWKDDPNYLMWHAGPVINDVKQLDDSLKQAVLNQEIYLPVQEKLFNSTFDINETSSSERAAIAIIEYIKENIRSDKILG